MIVVSNATPLIYLGKLGQLGRLFQLYNKVYIPQEVYTEVVINGLRLGAQEAPTVDFLVKEALLTMLPTTYSDPLPDWAAPIDRGELAVILLAQQKAACLALIDNLHARRAARKAGVPVKGTIGLLLDAFRQQYVTFTEFELMLSQIRTSADFWISDRLVDQAHEVARQLHQPPETKTS